jgi:hypothetical protein
VTCWMRLVLALLLALGTSAAAQADAAAELAKKRQTPIANLIYLAVAVRTARGDLGIRRQPAGLGHRCPDRQAIAEVGQLIRVDRVIVTEGSPDKPGLLGRRTRKSKAETVMRIIELQAGSGSARGGSVP